MGTTYMASPHKGDLRPMATSALYLKNSQLYAATAKVLRIVSGTAHPHSVVVDRTVFYPQGGGQPSDIGTIRSGDATFQVKHVYSADGVVFHEGDYLSSSRLLPNEDVQMQVDQSIRDLHSAIHSAGHLIDAVIERLGIELTPSKGHHSPEMSDVEYAEPIDYGKIGMTKQQLIEKMNELAQSLIVNDLKVSIYEKPVEDLTDAQKKMLSPRALVSPSIRFVEIDGSTAQPCAGTHVASTGQIKQLRITKIDHAKKRTRISYSVASK